MTNTFFIAALHMKPPTNLFFHSVPSIVLSEESVAHIYEHIYKSCSFYMHYPNKSIAVLTLVLTLYLYTTYLFPTSLPPYLSIIYLIYHYLYTHMYLYQIYVDFIKDYNYIYLKLNM